MPIDPNIPLAAGNIQTGFDPGKQISLAEMAIALQQQRQQVQGQNALRNIFSDPNSVDPATGILRPQALNQIGAIDPDTRMKLQQQQLQTQNLQSEIEARKTQNLDRDEERKAKDAEWLKDNVVEPAVVAREQAIDRGLAPEAADAEGQRIYSEGLENAKSTGRFGATDVAKWNPKFDYNKHLAQVTGVKQYLADRKAKQAADEQAKRDTLASDREKEQIRRDDALIAAQGKKGWTLGTDAEGHSVRINVDTGEIKPLSEDVKKQTGASNKTFSQKSSELMASLASEGVSLPTGFRSKEQQIALYDGLIDKYPDLTPDQIATKLKTGQIEFGAQKKETVTAAGQAGRVEVAQNEIKEFTPLVKEASAKVPRGAFVPLNRLMQMVDSSISDPNLKALKIRINSLLNAYDLLAARGGTDVEKRKEVRNLLMAADSPAALEAALDSFNLEADAAHRAAVKATRVPELDEPVGTPSPDKPKATATPKNVPNPKTGTVIPIPPQKFQEGIIYTDKNGKRARYENGQFIELK